MKKIKTLLAIFLLFTTFLSCESISYAAKSLGELQKEMEERGKEVKEKEAQIKAKQTEKDAEVNKRIELDVQITALETDIDSVETTISEKEKEIQEKTTQIEALQKIVEENQDTLKQRIRVTYEYGNISYLEVILEADGFADLLTRMSILKDIVNHDRKVINEYIAAKTEIENAKQIIETERNEQVAAKDILEEKKSSLQTLQAEKQKTIDALNSDISALEKEEAAAEAEYQSIMQEVQKAQAKLGQRKSVTPSNNSSSNSSSTSSSTPAITGTGQFVWPSAASSRVTSSFGWRQKPNANATSNHRGIDIGAPNGTDVLAADAGTVIVAGSGRSYGNYVVIDHGNGYTTLYAHNSRLCVSAGQKVSKGQLIAKVGSTGNSTGPHIHFEISKNGSLINPMSFY